MNRRRAHEDTKQPIRELLPTPDTRGDRTMSKPISTNRKTFNILSNVAFCALAITVQGNVAPDLTGWVAVGMWVLLARNIAFAALAIIGMAIKTAEASR